MKISFIWESVALLTVLIGVTSSNVHVSAGAIVFALIAISKRLEERP